MKVLHILPLVAAGSALVLPSEQVLHDVEIEKNHRNTEWYKDLVSAKDEVFSDSKELFEEYFDEAAEMAKDAWDRVHEYSDDALDDAFDHASDAADTLNDKFYHAASGFESWLDSEADEVYDIFDDTYDRPKHPHNKPNLTVYQMIAESKYTTKLAKLINEFDDLVEALNSTKGNYTVFAPTDKALDKIPDNAPKPSKEQLKKFLSYHVIPDFYPAKRVLFSHTAPTLFKSDHLGSDPQPQRLTFRVGLKGLTVNFYSRVVAANIFGTNGVIHGVAAPIFPPPSVITEIDLLPGSFSTLELGLGKTGLLEKLNTTDHAGGTFFAPSNWAFEKLGPRVNAFLFSQGGLKYLKALLEYHVVPDQTLYSDAYYDGSSSDVDAEDGRPVHFDLPTLLEDRKLAVDIARYGPFIEIKVNAFSRVSVQDGVADDGVIQIMDSVIVPPKTKGVEDVEYWDGEEMSVEELVERLEPLMIKNDL